jgi:7-cyano-7-deazaguanine reductase
MMKKKATDKKAPVTGAPGKKATVAKATGKGAPVMKRTSEPHGLTILGKKAKPAKVLETFPNQHPGRDYVVTLQTDEFTSLCPITGQPDFACITVKYIPDRLIVESKSLKLYFHSFRNEGVFHEHVTNRILDDLVAVLKPRWCMVTGDFSVRGGIAIVVETEYKKK